MLSKVSLVPRVAAVAVCAAFGLLATGLARAGLVLDYAGFAGVCGAALSCVGDTGEAGNTLRLTTASANNAGAGYSTTPILLGANASFSTQFQFQLTRPGGYAPADGLTFVLAATSGGLGVGGGGLGYGGVGRSVAIEFDGYNNGAMDGNSSNHVAVDVNGMTALSPLVNPYGRVSCDFGSASLHTMAGCMSNGNVWTVVISYDGQFLDVAIKDGDADSILIFDNYAIDIAGTLGTTSAFVGFTSATGAGYANQDILSWSLANDTSIGLPTTAPTFPPTMGPTMEPVGGPTTGPLGVPNGEPGAVPEPGSLVLVAMGLLAAAGLSRGRRASRPA